jgi:drug/metabolite transporter (DMT)-like permease
VVVQLETIPRAGRAVGLAASACVLVGAAVPVTGLLDGYPVLSAQAVRYGIGAVLLLGWLLVTGPRGSMSVPVPTAKDLIGLSVMVGFGMLGFNAAILVGQRYATPGFIAAMLGASPLVLAVVAPALRGRRPSPYAVGGAVVVGLGVVVLSGGGSWHGPGLALALLVMACEVAFTLGGVGVVARLGAVAASMWSCVLAAVGGAVVATFLDGAAAWPAPTATEVAAIVVLGSLVTAVAFGCWYTGVSVLGADRAGVLVGLMPVAGLAAAVALGRQPLTVVAAGGALLVAAGCALGLARPRRAMRSAARGSAQPPRAMRSTSSASSS